MEELRQLREHFNLFLKEHVISEISRSYVPEIAEVVIYSLGAPGKRVRPALCLAAAGYPVAGPQERSSEELLRGILFGDSSSTSTASKGGRDQEELRLRYKAALGAALALECIHTYSLIHDDLPAMDDDDLRRGRPTAHRAYSEWQAILAGDALHTYAFEKLAEFLEPLDSASLSTRLSLILARASGMAGMIGGQTLDLLHEKADEKQEQKKTQEKQTSSEALSVLKKIHKMKTAALIRASCEMGARLAGLSDTECRIYADYGERLGLLFQIADDLLDATGDAEKMGKAAGKDQGLGKWTYPGLLGLEQSRREARLLVEELKELSSAFSLPRPELRRFWLCLPDFVYQRDH